jgi:hypothetical protein
MSEAPPNTTCWRDGWAVNGPAASSSSAASAAGEAKSPVG